MANEKPIIGIVGAPGSGKTTVAGQFAAIGCGVISADQINHEVLNRPEIIAQLVEWWGLSVVRDQGRIDREAVAKIVFENAEELEKLTSLVHPLIEQRQNELIKILKNDPKIKAVVLDVPLLIEKKYHKLCDSIVFVQANETIRADRLGRSRGWDNKKIKKIENLQLSLDIKTEISEYTIRNNSSIPVTASQVGRVLTLVLEQKKR